jgi:carbon monoxide dehydrogenase subunit G
MSLLFEGERRFGMAPEQLWPKLRDASFLVHCIPDATVHGTPTRDRAECLVRPGFTFVRGQLETSIQILDAQEPAQVKFALASKGVGSQAAIETALALEPSESGTLVRWTADVTQLGGLLKMVPAGLIRGAAQQVIGQVWDSIETKLK